MPRKKKNAEPLPVQRHYDIRAVLPKLDAKFYAAVHKVKDGTSVPDDQWMIFLAKDDAFPPTLRYYLEECRRLGADQEHLESVERTIRRLDDWRAANADKCKVPDAKGEKLIG